MYLTTDAPLVSPRALPTWAARIVAVEPILAPVCALILLLAPNQLVWPAAVLGLVPSAARLLTTGRPWRATPFDLAFVLLGIGALLGGYASLSREGAAIRLFGLLAALLFFVTVREHASGPAALRRLVVGSLIAATATTALLLVLVGPFLLLERVPGLAELVAAVDPGGYRLWFVDQDWLLQRYRFRASGVGALADIGLALALAAWIGLSSGRSRLLVALTVPLFLVALVAADNRGSMVAGALTLGLMLTVWRRKLLVLVPVVALLGVLILAFGPSDRGLNLRTLAQRFWFWENSVVLAREVPLTGAGLGLESVQLVYRGYFLPSYPPFSHAHNIYLQGLLEYGVIGLLGLLGLGLATVWVGWRTAIGSDRWSVAGRLAGYGAAMAMFTTGLTEIVLHSTLGAALAIGALGLLASPPTPAKETSPPRPAKETSPPNPLSAPERGGRIACSPSPRRRGGWGVRSLVAVAVLLVLVAAVTLTGFGTTVAARVLLNAGTADLNRATLSESIERRDRSSALNRAVENLRLASTLAPNDPTIQRNLALALANNDEAREARTAADRARALLTEPQGRFDRAEMFQLARAYAAMSTWGEAIRAWESAGAAPQLIQLGNRLIRLRNFDQAIEAFSATARVDPRSRGAYDGVVRAARERRWNADRTVAALGPLMEPGAPTEFSARLQAARVLREEGRLQDALGYLQQAEAIWAPPELSFEYGLLWMAAGVPNGAVPLLARPAADLPYEPESWLWLARAQAARGQHADAVESIRQGLSRVDPSGQFAPPAERLPETAAVRAVEIRRPERAVLLGVMGESLIRQGRAAEAIPALDEAVAALPKDPWLAATRAEAQAVLEGAAPNLLLNPTFDRDGSWSLRASHWTWPEGWQMSMFLNETPTISEGRMRLAPADPASRAIVQDVFGLVPGHRYRLTLRLRTEGLGDGAALAFMTTTTSLDGAEWVARVRQSADWTTVTLEGEPSPALAGGLTVGFGFAPGTPAGAAVWCEEATLTDISSQR